MRTFWLYMLTLVIVIPLMAALAPTQPEIVCLIAGILIIDLWIRAVSHHFWLRARIWLLERMQVMLIHEVADTEEDARGSEGTPQHEIDLLALVAMRKEKEKCDARIAGLRARLTALEFADPT